MSFTCEWGGEVVGDGLVNGQNGKENGEHALKSPPAMPVVAAQVATPDQEGATEPAKAGTELDAFSFTNKRLCERWLDNLFMVSYEVRCPPFFI